MKNCFAACVCAGLSFSFCRMQPLKPYWNNSHPPETHPSGNLLLHLTPQLKPKQKTVSYMDELSGTLQDFSGSQLILNTDSASYVFNVSNATLNVKAA